MRGTSPTMRGASPTMRGTSRNDKRELKRVLEVAVATESNCGTGPQRRG